MRMTELVGRVREAIGSTGPADEMLVPELARALVKCPRMGWLHHLLGIALVRAEAGMGVPSAAVVERAAGCFQRAWTLEPACYMSGLNYVEALVMIGKREEAVEQARRVLRRIDDGRFQVADCRFEAESPSLTRRVSVGRPDTPTRDVSEGEDDAPSLTRRRSLAYASG